MRYDTWDRNIYTTIWNQARDFTEAAYIRANNYQRCIIRGNKLERDRKPKRTG
jgi:hypothetical protein